MAAVTDTGLSIPALTHTPLEHERLEAPAPLDFFTKDAIDHENRAIIEREQDRWRTLKWYERFKLYVRVQLLAWELQRAGYNRLITDVHGARLHLRAAKRAYLAATSEDEKRVIRERAKTLILSARPKIAELQRLKHIHQRYDNYLGWLDYERKNRREMLQKEKEERQIQRDMNREAKYLESLMVDVFRYTEGCHYRYTRSDKKEPVTKTPYFDRSIIKPDAHYFYLAASRRWLFGWRWLLPYGVTTDRLQEDDVLNNLRTATKRQVDVQRGVANQIIYRVSRLDSPDALPKEVKWREAMRFYPEDRRNKLPYCIGVNEGRKFQWQLDLATAPHIIIAGKSQSGKSNLVNGLIGAWVSKLSPAELRMVMIDMKGGVEFTHWHSLPHVLGDVIKTVEEVQPTLTRVLHILRKRLSLLERIKAKDIAAYNAKVGEKDQLARIVVLVDEMANFIGLGPLTEEIHNLITLLTSQGRAVGIHVVLATQYPEVKIIPTRIKANCEVKGSGFMPTQIASQVILDSPDAAYIANIPGRFVFAWGLHLLTVQVPRIYDEDIAQIVAAAQQQYTDVSEDVIDNDGAP